MKALKIFSIFSTILLVVLWVIFSNFGVVVPPNYIGVRQNFFGFINLKPGYMENGLEPGLHWTIPGVSVIHLIRKDFQIVDLDNTKQDDAEDDPTADLVKPSLEIGTSDGSKVKTDVSILVRYHTKQAELHLTNDEKAEENLNQVSAENDKEHDDCEEVIFPHKYKLSHSGPNELFQQISSKNSDWLERIAQTSEDELKRNLGSLKTIEYYNPCRRERATVLAERSANQRLASAGIEVFGILIRRYFYSDKSTDDKIFQKNLQEQTRLLNSAGGALAAAKAETEKERASWDAKIKDLRVDAEGRVAVLKSEGELIQAKKIAEGDLLVAKTQASIDGAKTSILANSQGVESYIGKELAPIIKTLQGGIVTDIDPYDLNGWVEKLTGGKK